MRKLTILVLCVLLLSGCAEVYRGPTETVYVLSEVTKAYYDYDGEVSVSERTVYSYDIYGDLAQTMEYANDEAVRKTVYTYDGRGNLVREEDYSLSGWFSDRTNLWEYTYDDRDRVTAEIYEYGDERTEHRYVYDDEANTRTTTYFGSVTVEHYDTNGFVIREEYRSGSEDRVTEYTRREDGQPLSERVTEADGQEYVYLYEYDEQGQCVGRYIQEGDARTEEYRYQFEYDEQGRELRMLDLTGGIRVEMTRQEYDDASRSVTSYSLGSKSHTIFCDEAGREVERLVYRSDGEVGLRITSTYRAIQVPAEGKEEP